jgi:hypothetical protein
MGKYKHGHSTRKGQSGAYSSWVEMKRRCYYKRGLHFKNYGGRGIAVCERWRFSFEYFLADMGQRPEGHEIDRVNNDGNYEPGNCRWVTREVNQLNKRSHHYITAFGKTQRLTEWARENGISYLKIYKRLQLGWPPEKAVSC